MTVSGNAFSEERAWWCPERISDEEIIKIAESELERRFGKSNVKGNYEVKISPDGCGYIYFIRDIPPRPGGFLMILINEKGEVVDYIPGV
jgi:hypothetical protein